jgi:transposase
MVAVSVYSRTIALEIGDIGRFPSHSALAAYVGVGKCPRESGKKKGRKARCGYNRRLHTAMFESAKIAIRLPGPDRDYYEKKLAGDMNEHQALHALVRKRVTIMFAMLRNMEGYRAA